MVLVTPNIVSLKTSSEDLSIDRRARSTVQRFLLVQKLRLKKELSPVCYIT